MNSLNEFMPDTTHMCEGTQKIQRLLFLLQFLLALFFYTLDAWNE